MPPLATTRAFSPRARRLVAASSRRTGRTMLKMVAMQR
jgi:hypothetical protein